MTLKIFLGKCLSVLLITMLSISELSAESLDFFRSTGKIYVVVGVICIIFIGIIFFIFRLDRKLTKLEKQINNE